MTLETHAAPLRRLQIDAIATEDVLKVLRPVWTAKAETALRLRGRIEQVLDAARVAGHRTGENPARWRGHLDKLLPKLARRMRAIMRRCPTLMFPPSSPAFGTNRASRRWRSNSRS